MKDADTKTPIMDEFCEEWYYAGPQEKIRALLEKARELEISLSTKQAEIDRLMEVAGNLAKQLCVESRRSFAMPASDTTLALAAFDEIRNPSPPSIHRGTKGEK